MRMADPTNRKHPQYEPYPSCYTLETPMDYYYYYYYYYYG